jgi:hypothetical protein
MAGCDKGSRHWADPCGCAAGVCWDKRNKWRASIRPSAGRRGKLMYLGLFPSEERAALAYDQAARRYLGNKAKLNFPHLTAQPDHASSEGVSALPPSQPHPASASLPLTDRQCLPGDASGEGDIGPGPAPPAPPSEEPEGFRAQGGVALDREPTTPGVSYQHRGEPRGA